MSNGPKGYRPPSKDDKLLRILQVLNSVTDLTSEQHDRLANAAIKLALDGLEDENE